MGKTPTLAGRLSSGCARNSKPLVSSAFTQTWYGSARMPDPGHTGTGTATGTPGHPYRVCPVPSRVEWPGTYRDGTGTCPAMSRLRSPFSLRVVGKGKRRGSSADAWRASGALDSAERAVDHRLLSVGKL